MLDDPPPESPPVEARVQHHRAARDQGGEQPHHLGVDVEQRQRAETDVGTGEGVVAGHRVRDVAELRLSQEDLFGGTRGA